MSESNSIDLPDLDTEGARHFLCDPPLSKELIYRLGKRGEIEGYLLCGKRLWVRNSLRAYKRRCIERGLQFAPEVPRRKPGRPRKIKPETSAAAE